jgi:hypothetical protein
MKHHYSKFGVLHLHWVIYKGLIAAKQKQNVDSWVFAYVMLIPELITMLCNKHINEHSMTET